jgi:hypothetical protein
MGDIPIRIQSLENFIRKSRGAKFFTESDGEIILFFENDMTAKNKAFEEGTVENKCIK